MSQINTERAPVLRALDPDLPFLATRAAIELDTVVAGRQTDLTAVRELAESLRNTTESGNGSGQRNLVMDPPTIDVFNRALLSVEKVPVTSIKELANKSLHIADQLRSISTDSPKESVEQMRDFCIALSRNASAYRESILDLEPPHPLRS